MFFLRVIIWLPAMIWRVHHVITIIIIIINNIDRSVFITTENTNYEAVGSECRQLNMYEWVTAKEQNQGFLITGCQLVFVSQIFT